MRPNPEVLWCKNMKRLAYPGGFLWETSPTALTSRWIPQSPHLNHKCLSFHHPSQVWVSWGMLGATKACWQWLSPPRDPAHPTPHWPLHFYPGVAPMLLVWGCDWFNINSVFPNHLDIRWCSSEQEQESFVKTIKLFPNTSDIIVKNVQRPSLTWTQSFFRAEDRLDICVGQILPTIPSLVKSPSVSQVEQNQVVNGPHCLRLCPDQLFLLWRCCVVAPPGGHRVGFIVRLATFYFYNLPSTW